MKEEIKLIVFLAQESRHVQHVKGQENKLFKPGEGSREA